MNILAIGAHPDDCEIKCGGTAAKLIRAGHTVRFVSATNGEKGHHKQEGQLLIDRRKKEARAAAETIGVESWVLDIPDGEIQPDLATRWRFIRMIREFKADVIITHRTWDYHPDHRITGQLVQDCSYLVRVPHVCPDVPVPDDAPVILLMADFFTQPRPFRADVVIPIDDVYDEKMRSLHCHTSQMYEWLPWVDKRTPPPEGEAERLAYLRDWVSPRDRKVAELAAHTGHTQASLEFAEAFEISEYGRQISPSELKAAWGI